MNVPSPAPADSWALVGHQCATCPGLRSIPLVAGRRHPWMQLSHLHFCTAQHQQPVSTATRRAFVGMGDVALGNLTQIFGQHIASDTVSVAAEIRQACLPVSQDRCCLARHHGRMLAGCIIYVQGEYVDKPKMYRYCTYKIQASPGFVNWGNQGI